MMKNRTNFTLVELLVVIVMIAVMAVLPLANLRKARAQAQTAACTDKLKQLGQLEAQYSNNYDGFLVQTASRHKARYHNNWFELPAKLDKSKSGMFYERQKKEWYPANRKFAQVPLCPSVTAPEEGQKLDSNGWGGYGRNSYLGFEDQADKDLAWRYPQVKQSELKNPAEILITGDAAMYYIQPGISWKKHARFPHDSQMNVLHGDGHTELHKGIQVESPGETPTRWDILHWRPDDKVNASGMPMAF